MIPGQLVEDFRDGSCIVFIGAGVSCEAKVPSAEILARSLAQEIRFPYDGEPLPEIAQYFENENRRPALYRHLLKLVKKPGIAPSMSHRLIAQLPATELVTTNWDTLMEEQLGDRCCLVVDNADLSSKPREQHDVRLIKMHGTIERPESMVITENDYHELLLKNRAICTEVMSLALKNTILFVGYGLGDLDFRIVYHLVRSSLRKHTRQSYAVLQNPHKWAVDNWKSNNIQIIVNSAQSALGELVKALKSIPLYEKLLVALMSHEGWSEEKARSEIEKTRRLYHFSSPQLAAYHLCLERGLLD